MGTALPATVPAGQNYSVAPGAAADNALPCFDFTGEAEDAPNMPSEREFAAATKTSTPP
eukprot:CAMPEP_0174915394 /NCGR_PEP_ID=MMETSP1355-20121228/1034_1 /TAXON_ID=464990 /ORGANISM="Hemiselmis tepida, Strain CCMP443" /LENGTH=58 /DNA_ID=CAMNT_0016160271 /DNA_START=25 /DNA_END=198 /DNA_ORIENTATION=-